MRYLPSPPRPSPNLPSPPLPLPHAALCGPHRRRLGNTPRGPGSTRLLPLRGARTGLWGQDGEPAGVKGAVWESGFTAMGQVTEESIGGHGVYRNPLSEPYHSRAHISSHIKHAVAYSSSFPSLPYPRGSPNMRRVPSLLRLPSGPIRPSLLGLISLPLCPSGHPPFADAVVQPRLLPRGRGSAGGRLQGEWGAGVGGAPTPRW